MILVANPAGQTPPKGEKRAAEVLTYTLDCSKLLDKFELITSASFSAQSGVTISNLRTRAGVSVEFKVENSALTSSEYLDFTLPIYFNTTFNNTRIAVMQLRVYK